MLKRYHLQEIISVISSHPTESVDGRDHNSGPLLEFAKAPAAANTETLSAV
jgi:hypothetical protein